MALAALVLVVFGAIECPSPKINKNCSAMKPTWLKIHAAA